MQILSGVHGKAQASIGEEMETMTSHFPLDMQARQSRW